MTITISMRLPLHSVLATTNTCAVKPAVVKFHYGCGFNGWALSYIKRKEFCLISNVLCCWLKIREIKFRSNVYFDFIVYIFPLHFRPNLRLWELGLLYILLLSEIYFSCFRLLQKYNCIMFQCSAIIFLLENCAERFYFVKFILEKNLVLLL